MTTFEPGARLVFTHGFDLSPLATAFFATKPAAIITDGFEVFVQLVIAAITTEPSITVPSGSSIAAAGFDPNGPEAASAEITVSGAAFGFAADFNLGSASANDFFTSLSATRSCGRLGPARLGSTVARSSSSASV